MIPAIGYTMCGADRRRLQTTASHVPLSTAVEFDLDCLSHGLDSASGLETERVTLHAVSLPVGSADCRTEPALSRLTEIARKSNAEAVIARLDAMPTTTADGSTVSRPRAWKAESADLCRQVEFVQSRLGAIPKRPIAFSAVSSRPWIMQLPAMAARSSAISGTTSWAYSARPWHTGMIPTAQSKQRERFIALSAR